MILDWKTTVPWLLSIATIGIGIWQYADKQAQANREPFLQQQLKLVFEATEVVSVLANTTDPKTWGEKRERFWVLYWGPLGVVESRLVARCMKLAGTKIPKPGEPIPELPMEQLDAISLALSHAARDLILSSWQVHLPKLDGSNSTVICQATPEQTAPASH